LPIADAVNRNRLGRLPDLMSPFAGANFSLRTHSHGYFLQEPDWRGSRNQYRGGEYLRGPNVYSPSGRFVSRDPSPNVRQRMYDDDLRFRERP
jgi:hypothetical protein